MRNDTEDEIFDDPALNEIEPPTNKTTPVSIEARATDWQNKADLVVEASLLGVPDTIAGVSLSSFSTARGSLLRRIGNEFVRGIKLVDISDPFLAVGKFLVIMSKPLPEARKLVADADALEDAAYELLDNVPISDIGVVVGQVNAYVHKEMQNRVHGEPFVAEGASKAPDGPKNS